MLQDVEHGDFSFKQARLFNSPSHKVKPKINVYAMHELEGHVS